MADRGGLLVPLLGPLVPEPERIQEELVPNSPQAGLDWIPFSSLARGDGYGLPGA